MRSLIAKKENSIVESGVQNRSANPVTPTTNQLWINTANKTLCFYDTVVKQIMSGYTQGNKQSELVELSLNTVDWTAGSVFRRINLQGANTLAFTNVVPGKTITIVCVAASLVNASVALPVAVKKIPTDDYTITAGKGIAIEVTEINGELHAKIVFKSNIAEFPSGTLGDLTINSGQTVNVAAGSILDYRNVTINAGGTLNIQGGASALVTIIGISDTFIHNGTITGIGGTFNDHNATIVTPTGETIVYTNAQQLGGKGGGNTGGAGTYGHGGGGKGGNSSYNGAGGGAGGAGGGNGGAGTTAPAGAGGAGMSTLGNGNNGVASGNRYGAGGAAGGGSGGGGGGGAGGGDGGAGGGGGGHKGRHGLALFLYAKNPIVGTGLINLAGQSGFKGGNGVTGTSTRTSGGGGGGAGGNGGKLWLRAPLEPSLSYSISAGVGGAGGAGGAPGNGASGTAGVAGTYDFQTNEE